MGQAGVGNRDRDANGSYNMTSIDLAHACRAGQPEDLELRMPGGGRNRLPKLGGGRGEPIHTAM